jgi:hypothetical protein
MGHFHWLKQCFTNKQKSLHNFSRDNPYKRKLIMATESKSHNNTKELPMNISLEGDLID